MTFVPLAPMQQTIPVHLALIYVPVATSSAPIAQAAKLAFWWISESVPIFA